MIYTRATIHSRRFAVDRSLLRIEEGGRIVYTLSTAKQPSSRDHEKPGRRRLA